MSLPIRLAIGLSIFAFLSITDLRRNGRSARRPAILLFTGLMATLFGFIGSRGWLNWCSDDFRMLAQTNLFRPSHFMTAWGAHLGAYIGGAIAVRVW